MIDCTAFQSQNLHTVFPYGSRTRLRSRSKHIKDSKERLFIMTQTHNLQIFGVIPFDELQNDI